MAFPKLDSCSADFVCSDAILLKLILRMLCPCRACWETAGYSPDQYGSSLYSIFTTLNLLFMGSWMMPKEWGLQVTRPAAGGVVQTHFQIQHYKRLHQ